MICMNHYIWLHLQCNGDYLHSIKDIKSRHPDRASAEIYLLKKRKKVMKTLDQERAVAFYIANKCSFSGLTESSSFSEQANANFNERN